MIKFSQSGNIFRSLQLCEVVTLKASLIANKAVTVLSLTQQRTRKSSNLGLNHKFRIKNNFKFRIK